MKKLLSVFLFSASLFAAAAFDFGLILSASPKYLQEDFSLSSTASPWFSALVGESVDIYLSGAVDFLIEDGEPDYRLDFGRTQVTYRPFPGMTAEAGRLPYADVGGFAATGLFDGIKARFSTPFAFVDFGIFYTGLLNKEKAGISLSAEDALDAADDDAYFAPRRVLAAISAQAPDLFGAAAASVEALGQVDLRGGDDTLHSQYLSASLSAKLPFGLTLKATGTGAVSVASGADAEFSAAAGGELSWFIPGGPGDRAYLAGSWASGDSGALGAFVPVKGGNAGKIFSAAAPGVAVLKGGYFIRALPWLSADLSAAAMLRQGDGVADAELDSGSDSAYLGTEIYGAFALAPVPEFSLLIGGGVFLPAAGGAFVSGADNRVMATATAVFSF